MHFIIDLIICAAIVVLALKGFYRGFWNEALALVGFLVALVVTAALYKPIGYFIADIIHLHRVGVSVVVFILLFIGVSYLFALAGRALTKVSDKIELSEINHVLGAVFGGFKAAFICGIVLMMLMKLPLGWLSTAVHEAMLAPYAVKIAQGLLNLFGLS
ncbi:MAG: CvpA family protein [Candidatus Lernaella stagnicola]|nr:CvpA family protein [Candidatus Lernaella stagnicola]